MQKLTYFYSTKNKRSDENEGTSNSRPVSVAEEASPEAQHENLAQEIGRYSLSSDSEVSEVENEQVN